MRNCNLGKLVAVVLLLMIFSSIVCVVYASSVQPRYAYVSNMTVSLDIRGGVAYYSGAGSGLYTHTNTKIYVMLQRKLTSGGAWSTVETKTATADSHYSAGCSGSEDADSGYTYRTYLMCVIYDANGNVLERATTYSHTIQCY